MIRLAANITLIDWGLPLQERPHAARLCGFDGVECLFPYDCPELPAARQRAGLPMVLINTPEPHWTEGARGCAAIPGQEQAFARDFDAALQQAHALDCGMIHLMAGNTQNAAAFDTFVANLRHAADLARDIILTIEPLNARDMPGYFLNDFDLAARVLDAADRPNVGLQFDSWHAARIHGDACAVWARHAGRVAHVQIAGLIGRGAPDMMRDDERRLLTDIARSGYSGWISAEYHPLAGDDAGWLPQVRRVLSDA